MKKLLAFLFVACFIAVGSIGCGGGDSATGGSKKSPSSSPAGSSSSPSHSGSGSSNS